MSITAKAEALARIVHWGQTYQGEPYADRHLADVVRRVEAAGGGAVGVAAAWLHDSVEDTPVSLLDVSTLLGSRVAEIVDVVTRRPGEKYSAYIERVRHSGDPEAVLVKRADLLSNLDAFRGPNSKKVTLAFRYRRALKVLTPY